MHANVSPSFDVDASLGFVTNNTRLIENDNSFLTVNGSGTASGVLPEDNRGWFFIPAELFAELAQQEANRFTGGFTGNWRPLVAHQPRDDRLRRGEPDRRAVLPDG